MPHINKDIVAVSHHPWDEHAVFVARSSLCSVDMPDSSIGNSGVVDRLRVPRCWQRVGYLQNHSPFQKMQVHHHRREQVVAAHAMDSLCNQCPAVVYTLDCLQNHWPGSYVLPRSLLPVSEPRTG